MTVDYKRQAILDSLYHHCQTRTYTSKEVLTNIMADIKIVLSTEQYENLLDVIREYKNTGKNLESTVNIIYDVFYPKTTTTDTDSGGKGYEDWDRI